MSDLALALVPSPVGVLRLVATDAALVGVYFPEHRRAPALAANERAGHPILEAAARELAEYFAGERRAFSVPLGARGTDFQRAVWTQLAAIPYGERVSYAELAARLGKPGAVRAVGSANGRNPLSIFVPCHRVVTSAGTLGGYAGGEAAKQWLLDHERAAQRSARRPTP